MTTSPDTINAAEATTTADATNANQATPASAGTTGGTVTATARTQPRPARMVRPDLDEEPISAFQRFLVGLFVAVPLVALVAAIPLLWGWGLGWHDVVIALVFYWVSGLGVTVGYHRYFTHGSFKAKTGLRVALAVAGSLAIEGPVITWVSDHRRHHKYSDKEGDPHSPWRYGDDAKALSKGLLFAHIGWLFDPNMTSQEKFSPDLLADRRIKTVDGWFPGLVAVSLLLPPLIGFLWGMSWQGALTAFFWASSGPGRAAAPRHLGDQLHLPHLRQRRNSRHATSRRTCPGWRSRRSVSPGTTCTTRTRPARGTAR